MDKSTECSPVGLNNSQRCVAWWGQAPLFPFFWRRGGVSEQTRQTRVQSPRHHPRSMIARVVGNANSIINKHRATLVEQAGPHQSSSRVKEGGDMVGIDSKLHTESRRHPIDAKTDFEAAPQHRP